MFHIDEFQRVGNLDDLKKATEYFLHALESTSKDYTGMSHRFGNLGVAYIVRFQRLGLIEDLEKAIEHCSRAVALSPEGHPHMPQWLTNLGVSYTDRFRRLGARDDLEKAIESSSRALALTPAGHSSRPSRLSDLGVSYSDRFQHHGQIEDLEKSIEYHSRAVALTPDGDPALAHRLANLGVSYDDRFHRLGELGDLEKSIEHKSRAVALTPGGDLELPGRLDGLGVSYSNCFLYLGEPDDLEKAVKHKYHAVLLTPNDHPSLSYRLTYLGASYANRFRSLGKFEDLEKSIDCHSRALALTPDGRPDLPSRYFGLAIASFLYHQHTGDRPRLKDSLDPFRQASQTLTGAPRDKFRYALRWAKRTSKHSSLNCIEAYQVTIDLLHQFVWLGASSSQRYQDLLVAKSLAVKAASAAIRSSNYTLALEWLENARCVVWNQSLMLRLPLDQLYLLSQRDLASRLRTIANQLHDSSFETQTFENFSSDTVTREQAAQKRRRIAVEYHDILAQITFFGQQTRMVFYVPLEMGPSWLSTAIRINVTHFSSFPVTTIIIHLPLPDFNEKKAQRARFELEASLRQHGLRERGFRVLQEPKHKQRIERVLGTLWKSVVRPIIEFLGYQNGVPVDNLPHITWCLTGGLSFLPLHAAGDYTQPHTRIFDYVISSYTPTLTALLTSSPSSLGYDSRILAIGQATTPGHNSLPGTIEELACVKEHAQNKAGYYQLVDNHATTTSVLDAMKQHDWVHLACHAHQNVDDPIKSGFYLQDGTLDLSAINQRSFKNKGLAFLSACQTATGDEKLPDEATHLASGMLMAGYPSVIATMWSVVDEDAPFVADQVYARLMKSGKVGNGEAGAALHWAVTALRDKVGETEFGRWVPYIHIGS